MTVSAVEKSKRRPFHATWSLLIVVAIASTAGLCAGSRCRSVAGRDKSSKVRTVDVVVSARCWAKAPVWRAAAVGHEAKSAAQVREAAGIRDVEVSQRWRLRRGLPGGVVQDGQIRIGPILIFPQRTTPLPAPRSPEV